MSNLNLANVSNLAAFAVECAAESGSRYQLVNPRGTTTLLFGIRRDESARWMTTTVVEPSRFGMDQPPRTIRAFLGIAEKFVNDEDDDRGA